VNPRPLVVVGDLLLDREVVGTVDRLCPEAPVPVLAERSIVDRPGGAGLAALFAAAGAGDDEPGPGGSDGSGREVVLVTAVSADAGGDRLRELLARTGVRLVELPLDGPTPEKIRLRAGDHLLLRLDRGDGDGEVGTAPAEALDAIRSAGTVLVSDYGRGIIAHPQVRAALTERAGRVPVVWDPHPRGDTPVPATRLVTPNRSEAAGFVSTLGAGGWRADSAGGEWSLVGLTMNHNGNGNGNGHKRPGARRDRSAADLAAAANAAIRLRRVWSAGAVVVTLADKGAVLSDGVHPPLLVPPPFPAHGDSCGAGDRFASAAAAALADGQPVLEAVTTAVTAATAFVAAGGALALHPDLHDRSEGATCLPYL
jgi:bifunctional ADP-heptose synthase (sugar kinase/adenylyltransferase)